MRSTRQAKEADAERKSRSNPVQKMEVHAGESDGGRGQADARRADSEGQREGEQQLLPTAREKLLRRFGGGAADAPNTRQSLQRQLAGKRSASAPISLQAKYADGGERACRAASGGPVGERAASALGRAERDPGAPLDEKVRSRAEGALGVDLGGVRVHTGAASQDAAASVRARAYTVGQDIHFGAGHYRPGSAEGERLIAHEVVHTVQQRGSAGVSAQPSLEVSTPGDHHEHEADSLASQITGPRNKPSVSAPGDSIGRPTALPVTRVARQVQLTPLSDAEAEYNKSKDKEQFIQAFEKHYAPVT